MTKLVLIGEFLLVSYLLYILTASVYKSYQIDQHIRNFESENAKIADENRKKSEEFDYYSSDAYIEKIGKQNLGLINPGEEVIIIPRENVNNSGLIGEKDKMSENSNRFNLNNSQRWWKFFFDMKR